MGNFKILKVLRYVMNTRDPRNPVLGKTHAKKLLDTVNVINIVTMKHIKGFSNQKILRNLISELEQLVSYFI